MEMSREILSETNEKEKVYSRIEANCRDHQVSDQHVQSHDAYSLPYSNMINKLPDGYTDHQMRELANQLLKQMNS